MFSWQSIFNFTLSPLVVFPIFAVLTIKFAHDIIEIKAMEVEAPLPSTIFPLQDFHFDKSNAPVFHPKQETLIYATPLHCAAYLGKNFLVRCLLMLFNVDTYPKEGVTTPLYLVLINGHHSTAKLLLKHSASPHENYASPLHAAARSGFLDEIHDFIKRDGVDADFEDMDGATLTVFALYLPEGQAMQTISRLFEEGANPNRVFGPESRYTLAGLAEAMGKRRLAFWLESKAYESYTYTNKRQGQAHGSSWVF
ncbi:hypothetical protein ACJZ2D_016310 [Fusarium nematophilum]